MCLYFSPFPDGLSPLFGCVAFFGAFCLPHFCKQSSMGPSNRCTTGHMRVLDVLFKLRLARLPLFDRGIELRDLLTHTRKRLGQRTCKQNAIQCGGVSFCGRERERDKRETRERQERERERKEAEIATERERERDERERERERYIYIYAVKLLSGPSLGFLNVIIWSKLGFFNVTIWSKFVFLPIKIVVSRALVCTLSYHFVFLFWCPSIWQFSKNSRFKKRVQKLGFSIFSALSIKFENSLFWVCQNTIKIGVSAIFSVFCCWKRRKQAKKNDNWNLWI